MLIAVAHNSDYGVLTTTLSKSIKQVQKGSANRMRYYLNRGRTVLEKAVYGFVNKKAKDTIFEGKIELLSSQKFPDIVAYGNSNKAYGLEGKTIKSNTRKPRCLLQRNILGAAIVAMRLTKNVN